MSRRKREAVACAAAKTNAGKGVGWKIFTNPRQIWIAAVALLLLGLGAAGAFSGKYKQSFAPGNEASINAATEPQQSVTHPSLLSKEYIYAGGRMLAVEDAANSISGTTPYGTTQPNQAAKFVPDVLITASGAPSVTTTTDSAGYYLLSNLTVGGNYTVAPSKPGYVSGGNSGITSFDATLVLRCVAANQACLLTPNEKIAADTNNDGTITSFDATLILRYVAANAQTANTGDVGDWEFIPNVREYLPLPGALAGENYTAIIIGEINGSWTPPPAGSVPAPEEIQQQSETEKAGILAQAKNLSTKIADGAIPVVSTAEQSQQQQPGTEGAMQISLPEDAAAAQGSTITIPVTLTNNTGTQLSAFSFDVQFNPAFLRPAGAEAVNTTGTISGDCEVIENTVTPGKVVIAGACRNNITAAAGTLVKLRFTVVGHPNNAAPEARALKFRLTHFEDSTGRQIAVGRTNGSVR